MAGLGLEQPQVLAGHSLGEYSALVCAGVIDFKAAIKLVELRGQLMQKPFQRVLWRYVAIIGLDDEAIAACEEAAQGDVVSPVELQLTRPEWLSLVRKTQ